MSSMVTTGFWFMGEDVGRRVLENIRTELGFARVRTYVSPTRFELGCLQYHQRDGDYMLYHTTMAGRIQSHANAFPYIGFASEQKPHLLRVPVVEFEVLPTSSIG